MWGSVTRAGITSHRWRNKLRSVADPIWRSDRERTTVAKGCACAVKSLVTALVQVDVRYVVSETRNMAVSHTTQTRYIFDGDYTQYIYLTIDEWTKLYVNKMLEIYLTLYSYVKAHYCTGVSLIKPGFYIIVSSVIVNCKYSSCWLATTINELQGFPSGLIWLVCIINYNLCKFI